MSNMVTGILLFFFARLILNFINIIKWDSGCTNNTKLLNSGKLCHSSMNDSLVDSATHHCYHHAPEGYIRHTRLNGVIVYEKQWKELKGLIWFENKLYRNFECHRYMLESCLNNKQKQVYSFV